MNAQEVIKQIQKAFSSIEKPEISLRQLQLTDLKGMSGEMTDEEWRLAGEKRQDSTWQEIPDSEIKACGCLLAHMGPHEFQYYLPAYMCFALKHYELEIWESDIIGSTIFSLKPSGKDTGLRSYNINQMSLLNTKQRDAIILFLEFVATHADFIQRPNARKALERYWYKANA